MNSNKSKDNKYLNLSLSNYFPTFNYALCPQGNLYLFYV